MIEAGQMLQQQIEAQNTTPAVHFGARKSKKRIITSNRTKKEHASLSSFGWKGSLSSEQRHKTLNKAVNNLGVQTTLVKLMSIQRLHRKKPTGRICTQDIAYIKKNYKK